MTATSRKRSQRRDVRVVIKPNAAAVHAEAARHLACFAAVRPNCVLGLATGATMEPVYAELARLHIEGSLSLQRATSFNLDEYVGVGPQAPHSFSVFMQRHLVERTDIDPAAVHLPNGLADDPADEALRYEQAIADAGGIDLQLLGVGRNGHIGFNEPGSSLGSLSRVKTLTTETLAANQHTLPDASETRPRAAITMGLATILAARSCVAVAVGPAKADAVAAMIEGPLTAMIPASVLQLHAAVTVIIDDEAAAQLTRRDYYMQAEELQRELEAPGPH